MVGYVSILANNSDVDHSLISCLLPTVVIAGMNVLKLVGSEYQRTLLVVIQQITRVASRVEVRDEGRGVVTSYEGLIMHD